jgi:hypothetical protein
MEKHCAAMLDAEYGPTAANMIRNAGLMDHPLRLTVNADWDKKVRGEQQACSSIKIVVLFRVPCRQQLLPANMLRCCRTAITASCSRH